MARSQQWHPYTDTLTPQARIQRLEHFFTWLYRDYAQQDTFDFDFLGVLSGLDISTGTTWESADLTAWLSRLDVAERHQLQRHVREKVEKRFATLLNPTTEYLEMRSQGATYQPCITVRAEPAGTVLRRGYLLRADEPPSRERVSEIIWLRLVDVLLHGINTAALVTCANCGHFTARLHPKGKTYCGPVCRVTAATRTRRNTQRAQRQATVIPLRPARSRKPKHRARA